LFASIRAALARFSSSCAVCAAAAAASAAANPPGRDARTGLVSADGRADVADDDVAPPRDDSFSRRARGGAGGDFGGAGG